MQSADDKVIAKPHLVYYPNFEIGRDPVKGTITYTFEVNFANGKFIYTINNFIHHGNPAAVYRTVNFGLITTETKSLIKIYNQLLSELAWKDIKSHITSQIMPLIANLKAEMTKATEKRDDR